MAVNLTLSWSAKGKSWAGAQLASGRHSVLLYPPEQLLSSDKGGGPMERGPYPA